MSVQLDFETQLHCVPIRNEKANSFSADSDPNVLIVEVRLRYKGLLSVAASLFGSRSVKRYELVGISREIYERLDGKMTVEDLVVSLADKEKLGFLEARSLIVQYLKDLMERGIVVIVAGARTAG